MDFDLKELREYIKENVLMTEEAARMLGTTRQNLLKNIVGKGELLYLKKLQGGYLFFRDDVLQYKNRKYRKFLDASDPHNKSFAFDDGTSVDALEYVAQEILPKKDDIELIAVYFDALNAILDNRYRVVDINPQDELKYTYTPTFVVRYLNGNEDWIRELNCGYKGTGPDHSHKALTLFGVPEKLCNYVYNYDKVVYRKSGDAWTIEDRISADDRTYFGSHNRIGFYRSNLVMVLYEDYAIAIDRPRFFLTEFSRFMPQPSKLVILDTENTSSLTRFGWGINSSTPIAAFIQDEAGRELWFPYYPDAQTLITRRECPIFLASESGGKVALLDVLESYCISYPMDIELPDSLRYWLETPVTVSDLREVW